MLFLSVEYPYMAQLRELDRRSGSSAGELPPSATAVVTPMREAEWAAVLHEHPDREWVQYLRAGIRNGFRVGFSGERGTLRSCSRNMKSAEEHPQVVQEYLDKEVAGGRIWDVGTVAEAAAMHVHRSPFGVIPKRNKPGKWRLILNLSAPDKASVNDGISKELSSLGYMSVDDLVQEVLRRGRDTEMAKTDVSQAYRNVPVHPEDRGLLGMEWQGRVLVDGTLPFGLRSAPLLFSALGDAIQWAVVQQGATWVKHYIDDFVTVGQAGTGECRRNLSALKGLCDRVGMPLDESKEEGPATVLTFLGIEVDSAQQIIRLPDGKLEAMRAMLKSWRGMKSCKKRDLLSIIGVLSHACKAIRAGRSFLRRLIDLSMTVKWLDRRVRLNLAARADLEWWWQFSRRWNGVAMMVAVKALPPAHDIVSDASGRWGCGAVCGRRWFQLRWQGWGNTQSWDITAKELLPIVIAAAVWGHEWSGKAVLSRCDNQAVVEIINSGSCREQDAMHLRRCLAFLEARWSFYLRAAHIRGVDNVVADALSRDNNVLARSLMQSAEDEPTVLPRDVVEVVAKVGNNSEETIWETLWQSSRTREWLRPPGGHTPQRGIDS